MTDPQTIAALTRPISLARRRSEFRGDTRVVVPRESIYAVLAFLQERAAVSICWSTSRASTI